MIPGHLKRKLALSLVLGLLVVLALSVYADLDSLLRAFGRFQWAYLPAILALTLSNYLLRCVKWRYFLGRIGVHSVGPLDSALLFFAGLSMVMTPGKVGEWLKSVLLREIAGTPVSRSAPIIVAERLSDGLAMLLLALGGVVVFGLGWELSVVVVVGAVVAVVASQYRPLAHLLLRLAGRLPGLSRWAPQLDAFYESAAAVLGPRSLAVAVGLGFVSWAGECLAFYLVLAGLSGDPWTLASGWLPLLQATFILAVATLAGSVLLLPGGLGVAEGSIAGLSQLLLGMPKDLAVVATLLIRFCTLWFGVALGIAALALVSRRLDAGAGARGRGPGSRDRFLTPTPPAGLGDIERPGT